MTLQYYDENENIDFPLITPNEDFDLARFPKNIFSDAGFIFCSTDLNKHPNIVLYSYSLFGTPQVDDPPFYGGESVTFVLKELTTGQTEEINVEVNHSVNTRFTFEFEDLVAGYFFAGYFVINSLASLFSSNFIPGAIETGGIDFLPYLFEPSSVQGICPEVRSIRLANQDRVPLPDVLGNIDDILIKEIDVDDTPNDLPGVTGNVVLEEGYNCVLRAVESDNSIQLTPYIGAGKGEPCDFWNPVIDEENCSDLVFSINGILPVDGNLTIEGTTPIHIVKALEPTDAGEPGHDPDPPVANFYSHAIEIKFAEAGVDIDCPEV